jgi:uncharacterized protein YbaA (DUF1428 family)
MTYIEGFVIPVPAANKQKFADHARIIDAMFIEHGATRVVECWQDKVEKGQTTDFFGAVACTEDEAVAFSWVEWADKGARQRGMGEIGTLMSTDPRLDPAKNPMPFDGKRMVFGRTAALAMWEIMKDYGAVRVIEAWQDDVTHGKQTDFFRAVKAEDGEMVVFSFVEWSSREVCESAHDNMMHDDRMKRFMGDNPDAKPPFDGKRMVWGGFMPVVDLTRQTTGATS